MGHEHLSSKNFSFNPKLHPSDSPGASGDKKKERAEDKAQDLDSSQGHASFFATASDPRVTEFLHKQSPHGVEFVPRTRQSPMKLRGSFDSTKTLNANDMETLTECQSEGDLKDHPLLMSCTSEDSVCQLSEVKKRKKVLSWPFLMRRLSPSSDFSGSLEPELKVSLFDQPLPVICGEEDTLPRPIQDILTILCLKGPSTEGIFRKAASEKARKELKEELNCGGAVELDGLPVHLLAVVFKDFLRGLPGKLLSCDLFEDWMDALEQQDDEDRIEALKQVADRLPRPNLLLLKHLLYVLHLISKNAEVNRMDSSNLAICIGPNMLSLENDQHLSFQAQKALNNKVKTLVEFLIDNCFEIFGENIPAHSRLTSDDSLDHTDSSDVSMLQNDSAYDSNDPDVESHSAVGSPGRPGPALAATTAGSDPGDPVVSTVARLKRAMGQQERRFSEPSVSPSQECLESRLTTRKLTKSQDDFTAPRPGPGGRGGQAEESFPAGGKPKRPADLKLQPAGPPGPAPEAFSSGSLDGSSDSSPGPSPSCPKRNFFTRHQSFTSKTEQGQPSRDVKKHSMSFSLASHRKALPRSPSFEAGKPKDMTREHGKKGWRKESQLAGRIVQESQADVHSHAAPGLRSPSWALSADDVFQLADGGTPGGPPSYQEALQLQASGFYGSQTVGSMRARLLSQDSKPPPLPHGQGASGGGTRGDHTPSPTTEHRKQSLTVGVSVETQAGPEFHRLRTRSESVQKGRQDSLRRRCSQPRFDADQLQYAKESYI